MFGPSMDMDRVISYNGFKVLCNLKAGTVRRFLEKHKEKITAVVFCTASATDTDIYKRLV